MRLLKATLSALTSFFLNLHWVYQSIVTTTAITTLLHLMAGNRRDAMREIHRKGVILTLTAVAHYVSLKVGLSISTPFDGQWTLGMVLACYYLLGDVLTMNEYLGKCGGGLPPSFVRSVKRVREDLFYETPDAGSLEETRRVGRKKVDHKVRR